MKRALLFFLLYLTCCSSHSSTCHFKKNLFGIPFSLVVGSFLTEKQKEEIEQIIDETFEEVDTIYNQWNPQSEVSQLNNLPPFVKTPLSSTLAQLFTLADELYYLSEGKFDPTVEPLVRLWKNCLKEGRLAEEETLKRLENSIGWFHIHVEDGLFWKDHGETTLDFGALAKGFALDRLLTKLENKGYTSLFAEWGGEVKTIGLHPEKRPWKIGIVNGGVIEMESGALATSGDYIQCWDVEGSIYYHIIDPQTKRPLKRTPFSIATASVQAPSCALADGLATTLLLFPSAEEAAKWAETHAVTCWLGIRSGTASSRDPSPAFSLFP